MVGALVLIPGLCMTARAQDSPHGELSIACEDCHNASSWKDVSGAMKFDHSKTKFALNGQHTQLACRQCHQDLKFATAPTACADCHTDVHRNELGNACDRCHSPQSWLVPDMAQRHNRTRFALMGPHQSLPCQSCHVNQQKQEYVNVPVDCVGCHRSTYDATTSPAHRAAGFGTDCQQCHSVTAVTWGGKFNHDMTGFSLTGAHGAAQCAACHVNNRFAGTPTQCQSCHLSQFNAAVNPKHVAGVFPMDCTTCHSMASWRPATFDHSKTAFPLTGAHASRQCVDCHTNAQYASTPTQCYSCHQTLYAAAGAPQHSPGLPTNCTGCHTTSAWQPSTFNHATTGFALSGAHATATCNGCHANGVYSNAATWCVGCHLSNFNTATNPVHTGPVFSTDCATCHSMVAWRPASFDHSKTAFPLTGAHAARQCVDCHTNTQYTSTPTQCYGCHQNLYASANAPLHSPGMPTDCAGCHTTTAWQPSVFNHSSTGFALTGAHASRQCADCHAAGVYATAATACVGCHLTNFNTALNPVHTGPAFSTDCATCHTTSAWKPASFDHSKTAFPLTGAHAARQCVDCHTNNQYTGTPTQCYACHQTLYASANAPRHSPGLPKDCTGCHTTTAWQPSTFNHSVTGFTLIGAHVTAQCNSCHANGFYSNASTTCIECHLSNYTAATNPNHRAAGIPTDCTNCHTTTAWIPASFDHSKTNFPLTGAHAARQCTDCHMNRQFMGTPVQCYACHHALYASASAPQHSPGLPTECTGCHNTTAWQPSTFNHTTTGFTLTGVHATAACGGCHPNGVYLSAPNACVGCHLPNYNATTNPNHAAAGFPTDCVTCHSTNAWQPSTWNHDTFFPISAGSTHPPGKWSTCADCHTVSTNYAVFECIFCHAHAQSAMDQAHTGVSGYQYNSAACYRCHPRGTGG